MRRFLFVVGVAVLASMIVIPGACVSIAITTGILTQKASK